MKLSRYQYQLEHALASIQPVQDRPLNDICDEFGITPWPELKLYSGDNGKLVQPLKLHQVDNAFSIVFRGLEGYRHTFLSNDMGTGKTKTYFTAIELNDRRKNKIYEHDIATQG